MRINYSFVEFHSPVFSSGKNHTNKIKASKDLELFYDSEIPNAKMCMKFKGKLTTFDTYHSADVIESAYSDQTPVGATKDKPHPASREARALRAQQESIARGE